MLNQTEWLTANDTLLLLFSLRHDFATKPVTAETLEATFR